MKIYFECECSMFMTRPCFISNKLQQCLFVWWWLLNATFNNISVISWWSGLLVEETRVLRKKNTDLSQVTDKLYHIKLYTSPWSRLELTTSVVIVTDCIGSCKSNYHKNALLNWYIFISLDKGWGVWTSYHGEFKDT